MKIAIIDADLIGRKRHRFPNLACMKLSGYHKSSGDEVTLKTDYVDLHTFDRVYISKVFTDTPIPDEVLQLPNVQYGGTGFFLDKAPPLPNEVEHSMPDYHLYDEWVAGQIKSGKNHGEFKYYTDYSIGYLTRGCYRGCDFCVNKNYKNVVPHSPIWEFLDWDRKKICLLDDNFFGYSHWMTLLQMLRETKKPFQFKQGLDFRLMDDNKCQWLFCASKYDGDYIFAFDNVADAERIEERLQIARKYTDSVMKFYCFCGFDRTDKWDDNFWAQDIFDLFKRIELLMKYRCLPYIMRYARYTESPYRGMYITIARWCNQPSFFKKKSLHEFAHANGENSSAVRYLREFEQAYPSIKPYFDMKFEEVANDQN